jgi:hypothetical protein
MAAYWTSQLGGSLCVGLAALFVFNLLQCNETGGGLHVESCCGGGILNGASSRSMDGPVFNGAGTAGFVLASSS